MEKDDVDRAFEMAGEKRSRRDETTAKTSRR